jgi:hypothetical protein
VPALADIARAFDRRSRQAIVLASAPTVASFGLILFGGFGLLASSVANQASAVIGLAVMLKRGKHVPQRFLPTSALPTMVPTKARASRSDRR